MALLQVLSFQILFLLPILCHYATAQTVVLDSSVGMRQACPGEMVTYTCTVNQGAVLEWIVEPFISGNDTILFVSTTPTGRSVNCNDVAAVQCADFNFVATLTNTSNSTTVMSTTLADMTSTLTLNATSRLRGTVVQCRGEIGDGTMVLANSTLNVAVVCTGPQTPLLPWHIALIVLGVLASLVALVVIISGMVVACGFSECCWSITVAFMFTTIIGIPIGIALIVLKSKKATKGDQHSQSNNCCNQACCFLGLYNGLTGFAYGLIWHGVAWWIMLAVTASRPGIWSRIVRDAVTSVITRDVIVAFCSSVAALIVAIVAVIFLLASRKLKGDCEGDDGQTKISHNEKEDY